MNLAEFVEETLTEILSGIRSAQQKEGGGAVAAITDAAVNHDNLMNLFGERGYLTIVDFDVSVAAETVAGGKAGIRVMSIGAEGGGERKSQESSRIKFAVPVHIPKGYDQSVKSFNRNLD